MTYRHLQKITKDKAQRVQIKKISLNNIAVMKLEIWLGCHRTNHV